MKTVSWHQVIEKGCFYQGIGAPILVKLRFDDYSSSQIREYEYSQFFHFLKCEWCGNLIFTCMYWAAYVFVCVVRILKKSSSRKEINKVNSLLIIRKFRINFARSYEFCYGSGIILLFPNLIKPLFLLSW